jgi:multidrug transporter EmrE-like cation transporter
MKTRHPCCKVLRGALILLTSVFAYLSLRKMPLGEFTAIVMLTPIVMTLISAFAFGEHVSPLRWLLIGVIFWGGLLVVGPGVATLSPSMLLPLATLALNNRVPPRHEPPRRGRRRCQRCSSGPAAPAPSSRRWRCPSSGSRSIRGACGPSSR